MRNMIYLARLLWRERWRFVLSFMNTLSGILADEANRLEDERNGFERCSNCVAGVGFWEDDKSFRECLGSCPLAADSQYLYPDEFVN